jgi:hypothetical protein
VVLAELEERRVGSDLGHKPSSIEELSLAPIHPPPPLVAYLVLQLLSKPVKSLVVLNRLCDTKAT